jgi:hypothetical protein
MAAITSPKPLSEEPFMNLKQVVALSVVFAIPAFGQTPTDRPSKLTKADVQKIVQSISGDKEKLQTYCDLAKLEQQIGDAAKDTETFQKTFADLNPKVDALVKKLGPDYTKLMDGLDQVDENSGEGNSVAASFDGVAAALDSLDNQCK